MPVATEYARLKERGGAEYMRAQSAYTAQWAKDNRERFNERRRNNFREQLARIKKQAADRGYCYELGDGAVEEMLKAPCTYCGEAAAPFNTVDRLDNARGYEEDNVAAC